MLAVRRAAVDNFGLGALAVGEPVSNLRRKFVPIWLLHRYQVESAVKAIGGVDFTYSLRGDGREAAVPVDASVQRRALDALMATLSPAELTVPDRLLPLLSSGWSGSSDRQFDIEIFRTAGGPVFDALVATDAAAAVTLRALLAPERLNRLAEQERTVRGSLGAHELLDRLIATAFPPGQATPVQRRIATTTAMTLARVQRDPELSPTLALELEDRLHQLGTRLAKATGNGVHEQWSRGLGRLLTDREALIEALAEPNRTPRVPPGMPIGSAEADWLGD
jgi:hypothetical protein